MERDILLRHDLEMYFGVLGKRKGEERQLYGYETWWVTEDRTATGMFRNARNASIGLSSDPCMSPTFLSTVLAIGPGRASVPSALRTQLPLALAMQRHGYGVEGLSTLADEIRAEFAHEPEWFMRRKVRERMNQLKRAADSATGSAGDRSSTGTDDDLLTEAADAAKQP